MNGTMKEINVAIERINVIPGVKKYDFSSEVFAEGVVM